MKLFVIVALLILCSCAARPSASPEQPAQPQTSSSLEKTEKVAVQDTLAPWDISERLASPASRAVFSKCQALLRGGKSQQVLETAAAFVKQQTTATEDVDPALAFVVAFAYIDQHNYDQALAWFASAYDKLEQAGPLARRIREQTTVLLKSLSPKVIDNLNQRWAAHPLIGPALTNEQTRRARGGEAVPLPYG